MQQRKTEKKEVNEKEEIQKQKAGSVTDVVSSGGGSLFSVCVCVCISACFCVCLYFVSVHVPFCACLGVSLHACVHVNVCMYMLYICACV